MSLKLKHKSNPKVPNLAIFCLLSHYSSHRTSHAPDITIVNKVLSIYIIKSHLNNGRSNVFLRINMTQKSESVPMRFINVFLYGYSFKRWINDNQLRIRN